MSDGRCSGKTSFDGFALTFLAKDEAETDRVFTAFSDGGQVRMPLDKTFFSQRFGMLVDRFGELDRDGSHERGVNDARRRD